MVDYKSIEREVWTLTEEGQELAESGSHEARVFDAVPAGEEGITIPDLQVSTICRISLSLQLSAQSLNVYYCGNRLNLVSLPALVKERPSRTNGSTKSPRIISYALSTALLIRLRLICNNFNLPAPSPMPNCLPIIRSASLPTSSK